MSAETDEPFTLEPEASAGPDTDEPITAETEAPDTPEPTFANATDSGGGGGSMAVPLALSAVILVCIIVVAVLIKTRRIGVVKRQTYKAAAKVKETAVSAGRKVRRTVKRSDKATPTPASPNNTILRDSELQNISSTVDQSEEPLLACPSLLEHELGGVRAASKFLPETPLDDTILDSLFELQRLLAALPSVPPTPREVTDTNTVSQANLRILREQAGGVETPPPPTPSASPTSRTVTPTHTPRQKRRKRFEFCPPEQEVGVLDQILIDIGRGGPGTPVGVAHTHPQTTLLQAHRDSRKLNRKIGEARIRADANHRVLSINIPAQLKCASSSHALCRDPGVLDVYETEGTLLDEMIENLNFPDTATSPSPLDVLAILTRQLAKNSIHPAIIQLCVFLYVSPSYVIDQCLGWGDAVRGIVHNKPVHLQWHFWPKLVTLLSAYALKQGDVPMGFTADMSGCDVKKGDCLCLPGLTLCAAENGVAVGMTFSSPAYILVGSDLALIPPLSLLRVMEVKQASCSAVCTVLPMSPLTKDALLQIDGQNAKLEAAAHMLEKRFVKQKGAYMNLFL